MYIRLVPGFSTIVNSSSAGATRSHCRSDPLSLAHHAPCHGQTRGAGLLLGSDPRGLGHGISTPPDIGVGIDGDPV
jgi:hypothetical protein